MTPFIKPRGEGECLNVLGESIRILVDGAASDGTLLVFEEVSPPGGGPPLHRHAREEEWFYVIDGTVKFSVDGHESVVGAGGFVFAPRGSRHTFLNVSDGPSRMLIGCRPAGLEGPFRACDRMAREGKLTPDSVAAAFRAIDLEFIGPPLKK